MIEGDTRNFAGYPKSCSDVDYALHQATLGSMPRSLADPINTNAIKSALTDNGISYEQEPTYRDLRTDNVHHSQADMSKVNSLLISQGIDGART